MKLMAIQVKKKKDERIEEEWEVQCLVLSSEV